MSPALLPYLHFLRATLTQLSTATLAEPAAAMQAGAACCLLDYMIEQCMVTPTLKIECYGSVQALLPAIEAVIVNPRSLPAVRTTIASAIVEVADSPPTAGASPAPAPNAGVLHELKALCAAANPDDFDRFAQRLAQIQHEMIDADIPPAAALCKSICGIEAEYHRSFKAAVAARSASTDGKTASIARNVREYDENALAAFIRRTFPQEVGVGIERSGFISGGYSKFTIGVTLSNTRSLPVEIILRADASATFGGASVVEEYRLLKIMYEKGVRVPQPLAVEESGQVFGSPFMLVERKPGISIGHMYKLPKPNKAVSREVAAQLAAIHRIPPAAFGDQVDNARGRSSDKALAWISEAVAAWRPLNMPSPAFETAFEWLRRHAQLNDRVPRTLVHGDVHLANMLVHEDKISAVLDWEFAHIGNPAYDLGYFYDQAVSLDSWEAFLQAYGEAGGCVPDQEQLDYNILLAATRLGVMTCQSIAEFTSGQKPGLAGAVVIGSFFYENTIIRISRALDRVLS